MKEFIRPNHTLGRTLGVQHIPSESMIARRNEQSFDRNGNNLAGWTIIHNGIRSYGKTFKPVLDGTPLKQLFAKKVKDLTEPKVLDLMASELFVIDAVYEGFDAGLAVSLGYPHDPYWDDKFGKGKVNMVNGDITQKTTWDEIQRRSREIAPEGFDIIISRPEGALEAKFIGEEPLLAFLMLQKMWLLGASRSTLLFQVPRRYATQFAEYAKVLTDNGIEVHIPGRFHRRIIHMASHPENGGSKYGFPVRIEKTSDSPRLLPKPTF